MIYGMHPDFLILVAMLGAYILWQVVRSSKARKTRTPLQDELMANGRKQTELLIRQAQALERIAAALEGKATDKSP
jgi:hypothetical protein